MKKTFKPGQIVFSGEGADCFQGKILRVRGKWATVKYLDFKVPREVHVSQLRGLLG